MNVIILGFGFMGRLYFNKLINFNNVYVKALFDKQFKPKFGKKHFNINNNFNGIISNNISFIIRKLKYSNCKVIITLPNHLHLKFIKLFKHSHILVEKPLLPNYNDFFNIYINKNFIFCALIERFNPAFSCFLYFVFPFFKNYINNISFIRINNKKNNNNINVLTDTSIHDLDLALALFNYNVIPNNIISTKTNNRAFIKFNIKNNNNFYVRIFSSINSFKRFRAAYFHLNNNFFFFIDLINNAIFLICPNKNFKPIFIHNNNIDQLQLMINAFIYNNYYLLNSFKQSQILLKLLDTHS